MGAPGDGHTLTGPVAIAVESRGERTALIDDLFVAGSPFRDHLFPSFLALPPANAFERLVTAEGDLLAAADGAGKLFIPFAFGSLVSGTGGLTRFLEARQAAVAGDGGARVESRGSSG